MWRSNHLVILAVILFCVGMFCLAQSRADMPMTGVGMGAPTPSGPCSQYTTLLAATSGWDSTHQTASQTLICGLVNQASTISGTLFSRMDVFYVFATNSSANAVINWISPGSFNGVAAGGATFTADAGFTGVDGSTTVYVNSGFNPTTAGSPNFTTNSAHVGVWSNTNVQAVSGGAVIGISADGVNQTNIFPKFSDGNAYFRINDSSPSAGTANANSTGHYVADRTGASASVGYKNGSALVTPNAAAGTIPNLPITILNQNSGSAGTELGGAYQIMNVSIGAGLSATDVANMCTLIGAYLHTVNGLTSPC